MQAQSSSTVNEVVATLALNKAALVAAARKPISRGYERVGASMGLLFVFFLVQQPFHGLTQTLVLLVTFGVSVFCLTEAIRKLNSRVEALAALLLEQQNR